MNNDTNLHCILSKNVKFTLEELSKLDPKTWHDVLLRLDGGLSRNWSRSLSTYMKNVAQSGIQSQLTIYFISQGSSWNGHMTLARNFHACLYEWHGHHKPLVSVARFFTHYLCTKFQIGPPPHHTLVAKRSTTSPEHPLSKLTLMRPVRLHIPECDHVHQGQRNTSVGTQGKVRHNFQT